MEKRRTKDRVGIRERLCHSLDIQPDVFPGECFIELRGRNSVTVKGGGRVLTYTDSTVRFALRHGALRIDGKRLCCSSYHRGAAVVDGLISSVIFEEER